MDEEYNPYLDKAHGFMAYLPTVLKVYLEGKKWSGWLDLPCRPDMLPDFKNFLYSITSYEFPLSPSSISASASILIKENSSLEYLQLLSSELQDLITTHENNFELQDALSAYLDKYELELDDNKILNLVNQADQLPIHRFSHVGIAERPYALTMLDGYCPGWEKIPLYGQLDFYSWARINARECGHVLLNESYLDLGDNAKLPDLTLHDRNYFKEQFNEKAPYLGTLERDQFAVQSSLLCEFEIVNVNNEPTKPFILKDTETGSPTLLYDFNKDDGNNYVLTDDYDHESRDYSDGIAYDNVYSALREYNKRVPRERQVAQYVKERRPQQSLNDAIQKKQEKEKPKPAKKERLAPGALAQRATEKAQQMQGRDGSRKFKARTR